MKDRFRIDSHKLMYHPDRLQQWREEGDVYPLYIEISPAGICNHRCTFCALDFMEYQKRFLDRKMLAGRLAEMGRLGVRSVMYAGEGEPFLHREMAQITEDTRKAGIDVAFTSNGVLLKEELARQVLPLSEWIKISFNAGSAETYAQIHRCPQSHFEQVLRNLERAAQLRAQQGWTVTLGMQLLLLPENAAEVVALARRAREVGMDYLVVKPYSQHPGSQTQRYRELDYSQFLQLEEELRDCSDERFQVVFRRNAMEKAAKQERGYDHCLAIPFWAYIDAGGNLWGCSVHLGNERFRYGNLYQEGFAEIWQGERRKRSLAWMREHLDLEHCRINCRMDAANCYLQDLSHPPDHVNFI